MGTGREELICLDSTERGQLKKGEFTLGPGSIQACVQHARIFTLLLSFEARRQQSLRTESDARSLLA